MKVFDPSTGNFVEHEELPDKELNDDISKDEDILGNEFDSLDDNDTLSEEEVERRKRQSKDDKERALIEKALKENEELKATTKALLGVIKEVTGKDFSDVNLGKKQEEQITRANSPQDFMPKDEKFDAVDSYGDPDSVSYKARVSYERNLENFTIATARAEAFKFRAEDEQRSQFFNAKERIMSDETLGFTEDEFEQFSKDLQRQGVFSVEDFAVMWKAKKTGKFSPEVITRINRGKPGTASFRKEEKTNKRQELREEYKEQYGRYPLT